MKTTLFILAMLVGAPALAADVSVSVNIGEPTFFGRIDIDSYPRPQLIFARPVVIERVPVHEVRAPLYLRVPPGHEKHWSKHCREYDACGVPVYFVEDRWYNTVYVPEYRKKHGHSEDRDDERGDHGEHGKGKGKGKGHDRD